VYGVRLFKGGRPCVIVVDDLLPCMYGDRPAFATARHNDVLWPSVMEKAYAKLHGAYDAIVGGHVTDALQDFTGGVPEMISINRDAMAASIHDGSLFAKVKAYADSGHLIGSGSNAGRDVPEDAVQGIVQGHAYSILRVVEEDGHQLLHLRNPWGRTEWTGKWGDKWLKNKGSQRMKKLLNWKDEDDGAFWMEFSDFCVLFDSIYVCKLFKLVADGGQWHSASIRGEWRGESAACWRKMGNNPQYKMTIERPSTVFIAASQEDLRGKRKHYAICVNLWKGSGTRGTEMGDSGNYTYLRSVNMEVQRLEPGEYTIVVSTFEAGQEGQFHIEVHAENSVVLELRTKK